MIEPLHHFTVEHTIHDRQVDHHARALIDRPPDSYRAGVRVPVIVRACTQSKDLEVLLVAPLRLPITVCRGEADPPVQLSGAHAGVSVSAAGRASRRPSTRDY